MPTTIRTFPEEISLRRAGFFATDSSPCPYEMRASLREANYGEEDFLRVVYVTTYGVMGGLTLLYKGAVALYFFRRRAAVAAALEAAE